MTEESAIVFTADSFYFVKSSKSARLLGLNYGVPESRKAFGVEFIFPGEIMDINILKGLKKEKTLLLPLDELTPNPLQPRRKFDTDELNALRDSIKVYGVIQPVAVKKIENLPFPMPKSKAKYEIIAGERRWRASKMAGLTHIPCVIFDADRKDSALMALVENLQRSDLSFFEEALAMQTLMLMTEKSQTELAKSLSISQSTLSNKIRLLRLSERERLMAMENGFSERHCRALVRIESEKERRPIMLAIIKEKLSAPETEHLVEEILKGTEITEKPNPPKKPKGKPKIKGYIKDLRVLYNTLDKAVKLLGSSGYKAKWIKEETENGIEVKISISAG